MATFVGEKIDVTFTHPPVAAKRPPAPESFVWHGRRFTVREVLAEWQDFERPAEQRVIFERAPFNLRAGGRHASWGFGKTYFRIRASTDGSVETGAFEVFYDRRPSGKSRLGSWTLYRTLAEEDLLPGKSC